MKKKIPIIKIIWSHDYLLFIMGIPIPGKMVFIKKDQVFGIGCY